MARYEAIPFSDNDLARRRLESTVDQSLHSLSFATSTLASLPSASSASATGSDTTHPRPFSAHGPEVSAISSSSTLSSLEYARAPVVSAHHLRGDHHLGIGQRTLSLSRQSDQETPRPTAAAWNSAMSSRPTSPVSTAGHHVSALSLGDGVFARASAAPARRSAGVTADEFDPERSLGRLVGELGKAMGEVCPPNEYRGQGLIRLKKIQPRPASPFSPPRSPRSPSPLPSMLNPSQAQRRHRNPSPSLTLSRADPLPSPPTSRSSSGSTSHEEVKRPGPTGSSGFSALAHQLERELRAPSRPEKKAESRSAPNRPPLGETNRHNLPVPHHPKSRVKKGALADLTGMTALMGTPAKGASFEGLGKNGQVGGDGDGTVQRALAELQARLRALENENSVSRRRVRELEEELERAKDEVAVAQRRGEGRLREVVGEKTALEELIRSLRAHLARLTVELEEHKTLVASLRTAQTGPHSNLSRPSYLSPPRPEHRGQLPVGPASGSPSVAAELRALKDQVERLGTEVHRLGGIVQEGLDTRRRTRGDDTVQTGEREPSPEMEAMRELQLGQEELERAKRDVQRRQAKLGSLGSRATRGARKDGDEEPVLIDLNDQERPSAPSRLRQGLHQAGVGQPGLMPPTVGPVARTRSAPTRAQRPARDGDVGSESEGVMGDEQEEEDRECALDSPTPPSRPSSRSLPLGRPDLPDNKSTKSKHTSRFKSARRAPLPADGPSSPFPSIREEDEESFFSSASVSASPVPSIRGAQSAPATKRMSGLRLAGEGELPPQTVLARVVRELEDDFGHYRAVYAELADSYKLLDPSGSTAKRRVLAEHLKEVIDTLEAKAEHIAVLYSLLEYKDGRDPLAAVAAAATEQEKRDRRKVRSVPDVLRMVRESLGNEAVRRLRAEMGF